MKIISEWKVLLQGHEGMITDLLLTQDEKFLISASEDSTIKYWNIENQRVINTFSGHKKAVTSLALSSDEKYLASGSKDRIVLIWNLETGKKLKKFNESQINSEIIGIEWIPDSDRIVICERYGTILIWNWMTNEVEILSEKSAHDSHYNQTILSPGGRYLLIGYGYRNITDSLLNPSFPEMRWGGISIWDLDSKEWVKGLFTQHDDEVRDICFFPNGKFLATVAGEQDKRLRIWDFWTNTLLSEYLSDSVVSPLSYGLSCVIALSTNIDVAFGGWDNKAIFIWNMEKESITVKLTGHDGWVTVLKTSNGGNLLFSGSTDKTIRVWEIGKVIIPAIDTSESLFKEVSTSLKDILLEIHVFSDVLENHFSSVNLTQTPTIQTQLDTIVMEIRDLAQRTTTYSDFKEEITIKLGSWVTTVLRDNLINIEEQMSEFKIDQRFLIEGMRKILFLTRWDDLPYVVHLERHKGKFRDTIRIWFGCSSCGLVIEPPIETKKLRRWVRVSLAGAHASLSTVFVLLDVSKEKLIEKYQKIWAEWENKTELPKVLVDQMLVDYKNYSVLKTLFLGSKEVFVNFHYHSIEGWICKNCILKTQNVE